MIAIPQYTDVARRIALKTPMLSYVMIQVAFWLMANNLMGIIIHYHSLLIARSFHLPIQSDLRSVALLASVLGILYGSILGAMHYKLERGFFRDLCLGKAIIVRLIVTFLFGIIVFSTLSLSSVHLYVPLLMPQAKFSLTDTTWQYCFIMYMLFYLIMTLLLGFINLMSKKYGPGVLIPLLAGKYATPTEDEKIFMFMDLKSSTTIAESLGNIKYSSFMRDYFWDINHVLSQYEAEIYQYVGDEIIVTWRAHDDSCIRFFFSCEQRFLQRAAYYKANYNIVPTFKAGIHMGKITAVEVGDIKREIAYHGDTINTTARIQQLCNSLNKRLLASEYLLSQCRIGKHFKTEGLGSILLKGKLSTIAIASIEQA